MTSPTESLSLSLSHVVRSPWLIALGAIACLSGCSSDVPDRHATGGANATGQTGGSPAQGGSSANNSVGGKSSTSVGGATNQGGSGNATGGVISTGTSTGGSAGGNGTGTTGGASTGGSGTTLQGGAATGGASTTGGSKAATGGGCPTGVTVSAGGVPQMTASGVDVVTVPLTAAPVGGTIPGQRFNYQNYDTPQKTFDLTCSSLNILAYAPGVTSGDLRVYFTSLGRYDSTAVNIAFASLANGFTTISIPVPPASVNYDPAVLIIVRLEFEADPNYGTTFQPTTVIYIDKIWTSNGLFNDTFDTDVTVANNLLFGTSGARPLTGTTLTWMSQYPPSAGTGGASSTGGSSATSTGGSVSGSGGASAATGGSPPTGGSPATGGNAATGGNSTASGGAT